LLPERVNVIVSDIRGALPLFGQGIHTLNDARKRLLAENGRMIPERDTLFAALVEAPENYERIIAPWKSVPGLNLEAAMPVVLNTMYKRQCKPGATSLCMRKRGMCWTTPMERTHGRARSAIPHESIGDSACFTVWFAAKLYEDIGFRTEPGTKDSVYGQVFLPLFQPVAVSAGEEIHADLHADLVGTDYVWRWDFEIAPRNGREPVKFRQSTFKAEVCRRRRCANGRRSLSRCCPKRVWRSAGS